MSSTTFPSVPYYAVIFTSSLKEPAIGYQKMANKMVELASKQNGFLGYESAREALGITISYWENEKDILNWKSNIEHLAAQNKGIKDWYDSYTVRVCKVERTYSFKSK